LNTFVKITMPITSIWLFFWALSLRWRLYAHKGFVWKPLVLRNICNAEPEKASKERSFGRSMYSTAKSKLVTKSLLNCLSIGNNDFCIAPFCRKLIRYLCMMLRIYFWSWIYRTALILFVLDNVIGRYEIIRRKVVKRTNLARFRNFATSCVFMHCNMCTSPL